MYVNKSMWSRKLSEQLGGMDEEAFSRAFNKAFDLALDTESIKTTLGNIFEVKIKAEFEKLHTEIESLRTTISRKEERIKSLETKVEKLENDQDELEQYSRRNSLRVAGIPEDNEQDPVDAVLSLFNATMSMSAADEEVRPEDLDRVHRVGKGERGKTRQILVKFATYRVRRRVFAAKRRLNPRHRDWTGPANEGHGPGTGAVREEPAGAPDPHARVFINEDLTRVRYTLLFNARKAKREGTIDGCWSADGQVLIKSKAGRVIPINCDKDLNEAKAQRNPAQSDSEED